MEGTAYPPRVQTDPLTAVQRIGRKAAYNGLYGGLIIALLSHVIPVSSRDFTPYYIRLWEEALRRDLKGYMLVEVEVDMVDNDEKKDEPKEPEPEPPPPEPEPDPVQPDVIDPPDPVDPPDPTDPPPDDDTPPPDDPYADIEPPPEAAQVGNALTAEGVDLTGEGLVTNPHGDGYKGGYSSSKGTGKTAQNNPNAKTGGKPGGKGTGPAKPPAPKYTGPNLSAPPLPIGSWRSCGFPAQANLEQIDRATVLVSVTVSADGRALRASVQSDPGYGFGSLARSCAMAKRYKPGKNRAGKPVTKSQVYRVKFTR